MPLCLPPVPLPRPPPPAPAPATVPEERQLGSKVDPSLHATLSSTFSGPAPSRTIGVDKASSERAADFPSASHNDDPTEKKSRQKPVSEPKYLLRCRYGCDGQSGPFKKVTSLRRHMMVVHHILPDRLRDKVRNCGCCGRLFTTESELKKHVELTRFCEVSPESRAKWNVLPPTSRQQRANTWCYEEDGTPSDEILVPNPDYTVTSESEQRVPKKRNKRKAADEEDLECATNQKKACRRETVQPERVVIDLCSPQTEAVQPPESRHSQDTPNRDLDTSSQSTQSLEASLQTTVQNSFPLQGIDLHNHTPNPSPQHFQQPPIPPDPTSFFEWTGDKKQPYVPGNLPSLHGTDAHLARSHNLPLLTSGWAFSTPPTVDHLPRLPPDHPLIGPVAESLRAAREYYVQFDVRRNTLAGVKAAAKTQHRHLPQQQRQQQQWIRGTQNRPPIHPSTAKTSHARFVPTSHYSAPQLPQRRQGWQQQTRTPRPPQYPPTRPPMPPNLRRTWTPGLPAVQ